MAAQGVTHPFMRAADSLTPRAQRRVKGGGASPLLPVGCLGYVTTQLQKAHTGIIFILLHYFPPAPPREGEREGRSVYWLRRGRRGSVRQGDPWPPSMRVVWMAGPLPECVGLNVCENTNPFSQSAHFPTQVMLSIPPWKVSLLTSLIPAFSNSDPRFTRRSSRSSKRTWRRLRRMFPLKRRRSSLLARGDCAYRCVAGSLFTPHRSHSSSELLLNLSR